MWQDWPMDWNYGFGRSPECRSYANDADAGTFTFSDCATSDVIATHIATGTLPPQLPPMFSRAWNDRNVGTCCGNCSVGVQEVRLYYFKEQDSGDCATDETANATLGSSKKVEARAHSLIADGGIAVVSGHTL